MPIIQLETQMNSTLEICFDLSRSIDLHQMSTSKTQERAIMGVTKGLIGINEMVTWEAVHFGVKQQLTTKITQYERPAHFRDEQVKGAFDYFIHDHFFYQQGEWVIMKDRFEFGSPLGFLGKVFNYFILTKYMTDFLQERNETIKGFAESEKWKTVLGPA